MFSRREGIEVLVVSLTGGFAGAVLTLAVRFHATADNLLNFLGGAVGSGLAVVAALYLESRKKAGTIEKLTDAIILLAVSADAVAYIEPARFAVGLANLLVVGRDVRTAYEAADLPALRRYPVSVVVHTIEESVEPIRAIRQKLLDGGAQPESEQIDYRRTLLSIRDVAIDTFEEDEGWTRGTRLAAQEAIRRFRAADKLRAG